ncbi:GGDEF domain-containing protein [Polynucleobacter sp. 86C-FISCH]|uniref:bifunctional diguanylate cyclase/phosphodiesterase n=1 Tax=Polynucleobacter sp. 86C-FISCH TaxID=2689101 RepID=UPI001C0CC7BB|nr:sensor domain-containing diguanylate cyclase [Polynucleobacter sp. 86C-FISCH]MBU3594875.1 GGDEF domain-containing protein [Polynucleobacter sp. 86C-FISCH]
MVYFVPPVVKRNTRIIIITAILLAVMLIANAVVSAYLLRENTIKSRMNQLSNLTVILAEHTSQTIYSAKTALESIEDVLELSNIQTEQDYRKFATQKQQFDLLEEKTKSNSIIDVATFVGKDGEVLNFSRSYPAPKINLAERDYFQYLSVNDDPETFFSLPVQNKGNGKWVFYLAKRVNGSNNKFLGVILVGVSVEVFSSLYERIGASLGNGSSVTLYRKDHRLLTRWPFVDKMIGKLNTGTVIQTSLQNEEDGGVIFTSAPGFNMNNDPVERMVSFRNVNGYPLIVGSTVTKELYLAGWHSSLWGVIYTTVFSLALILLATLLLIRTYQKNAKAEYFAHHDALTDLPNRLLLSDRIQVAMTLAKRNSSKMGILFVDLDNLKTINDTVSHQAGDAVLIESAKRMQASIRDSDTIGRVGGDEFIVLLPDLHSETDALVVANKILKNIAAIIPFEGIELSTSVSIGVAIYPDHGLDQVELINNADIAMYAAKTSGRNAIRVFGTPVLAETIKVLC